MKTFFVSAFLLILLIIAISCEKKDTILKDTIPIVLTRNITLITSSTALSGGYISDDWGDSINVRGVCWSTSQNPTISNSITTDGSGIGRFKSKITGLTANTTYYIRAYATFSGGIGYGNTLKFTTVETITDIDGNVYNTVIIGIQTWMKENLKVTHYRNGDSILNETDNYKWSTQTTGSFCDYYNIPAVGNIYGKLYNFYAVSDSRNLCPSGWHVPTNSESTAMIDYLGGESIAGGKLKEEGRTHWGMSNSDVTNESGFTALPGGCRDYSGYFVYIGTQGCWWNSTETSTERAYCWNLDAYWGGAGPRGIGLKQNGHSVRCIKD